MLVRCVVALLALGALCGSPAAADTDRDAATKHVGRGISYYVMGKYEEAIAEFESAYVLYASDSLLFNLAQAHRKLDQCAEALRYYERFLERSPSSSLARDVRALLPKLRRACEVKSTPPAGVTRPPPSRFAGSGTCRHSRRPAGVRRPASASTGCWPAAHGSASCPRTSTRRRASCGEIFRRPTAWWASSARPSA